MAAGQNGASPALLWVVVETTPCNPMPPSYATWKTTNSGLTSFFYLRQRESGSCLRQASSENVLGDREWKEILLCYV